MATKSNNNFRSNQRVPAGFGHARAAERSEGSNSGSDSRSRSDMSSSESGSSNVGSRNKFGSVSSKGKKKKDRSSASSSSSGEEPTKLKINNKGRTVSEVKKHHGRTKHGNPFESSAASSSAPAPSSQSSKVNSASNVTKIASTSGNGVVLVHQLAPFSESIHKDVSEFIIRVDGKSVADIAEQSDANGDLILSLGDGITIERTVPSIDQKVQSNAKTYSASDLHKDVTNDSSKMRSKSHVAYDVRIVNSHNPFPCALKFCCPTIVGSSKDIAFSGNDAKDRQALTFTLQQGEKLSNHVIFTNNNFDKKNFAFFSAFPTFTADNLRDGVMPAMAGENGVERVLVPHDNKGKMHPVVTLAQMDIARSLSAEEKRKNNGTIPPHLMVQSTDFAGYTIMNKDVFDKYAARCEQGLRAGQPLSDLSNPYCKVSLGNRSLFSDKTSSTGSSKTRLDSASHVQSSAKAAWLNNPQLSAGRTSESKKEAAKTTPYSAYARIQVRSVQTVNLADVMDLDETR